MKLQNVHCVIDLQISIEQIFQYPYTVSLILCSLVFFGDLFRIKPGLMLDFCVKGINFPSGGLGV